MVYWELIDANGIQSFVVTNEDKRPMDEGVNEADFVQVNQLERLPEEGEIYQNGEYLADSTKLDPELQRQIDEQAGQFRKNFITDVPGQQATYMEKEKQAKAVVEGDTSDCMMIQAEADVRGITLAEMANIIVSISNDWKCLSAQIEARRIKAKADVVAATTKEAKEAAANVNWWELVPLVKPR